MSDDIKDSIINKIFYISNQTMKNIIQIIPFFIFLSCVLLWFHLNEINRLDLFMPSMTNISSMIPIILSFSLYIITLVTPSIPLFILPFLFRKENGTNDTNIPIRLSLTIILSLLIFAISIPSIAYIFYKLQINPNYYMITILVLNFATSSVIIHFTLGFKKTTIKAITIIIIICITMKLSFKPLYPLLIQVSEATPKSFISISLTLSFYIFCIFTPSILYVYSNIKNNHFNINLLAFSLMLFIAPMFFIKEVNSYVIEKTMISIGITDWCVNTYRIDGEKYSKDMFPTEYWDTKTQGNHFYINATAPFYLGDKILLCPEYLSENYSKTLLINNDIQVKERTLLKKLVKNQFQNCFIFNNAYVDKSNTSFTNILKTNQLPVNEKCI